MKIRLTPLASRQFASPLMLPTATRHGVTARRRSLASAILICVSLFVLVWVVVLAGQWILYSTPDIGVVELAAQDRPPPVPRLKERKLRVMVLHVSVPLADQKGADARLVRILRVLQNEGHSVTFVGWKEERGQQSSHVEQLGPLVTDIVTVLETRRSSEYVGMDDREVPMARLERLPEIVCGGAPFDAAVVFVWDNRQYMLLVAELVATFQAYSPGTRLIALTDDVHHAAAASMGLAEYAARLRPAETAVLSMFHAVATATEEDQRALAELLGRDVGLMRVVADAMASPGRLPVRWKGRGSFVYVGYCNDQNRMAVTWLLDEVYPLLARYFDGPVPPLDIIGSIDCVKGERDGAGVRWHGGVRHVGDLLSSARVMMSPVLAGTGIATKNLLAMQHGVPLVTTELGGRALHLACGGVVTTDEPAVFAREAARLYQSEADWAAASDAALTHVQRYFAPRLLRDDIRSVLDASRPAPARTGMCGDYMLLWRLWRDFE